MNEIFERITSQGPRFLSTLSNLVCRPRAFFSELKLDKKNALGTALEFVISCLLVAFVFQLPFITSAQELWTIFTTLLIVFVVTCCLISTANKAGFRVVGGAATFKDHLIVTFYVTGPAYLIGAIFGLMSQGLLIVNEPEMLELFKIQIGSGALKTKESTFALFDSQFGLKATMLYTAGQVLALVWILYNWRAYQMINRVNTARSVVAFFLSFAVLIPLSWLISVMRDTFNLLIFGIG